MTISRLMVGDIGAKVVALQLRLTALGFAISQEERKRKLFGPSTRAALLRWQRKNGLEPSGSIDAETARRLASITADDGGVRSEKFEDAILPIGNGDPTTNLTDDSSSKKEIRSPDGKESNSPFETASFDSSSGFLIGPLHLLEQGPAVASLHNLLQKLQFDVAGTEIEFKRFGKSTRKAVIAFQQQEGLTPTGMVDTETLEVLSEKSRADETGQHRAALHRSVNSLRKIPKLGIKARKLGEHGGPIAEEFQGRMESFLKQRLVRLFEQPSEKLVASIEQLPIDLNEIEGLNFKDYVFTKVVPELIKESALEGELFGITERQVKIETSAISEMLGLDRDIRESEFFRDLANLARNYALGDMVSLGEDEIEALAEINLLAVDGQTFGRLVADGKLSADRKDDLRAAAEFARLTDDNFELVRTLWSQGSRRPKDLISKNHTDWSALLNENAIDPPDGETRDSYARLLDAGVECAFPTAYAMERFANRAPTADLDLLPDLEDVRPGEKGLFVDGSVAGDIDLSRLPRSVRKRALKGLQKLNRIANRYTALGVRDILNDSDLSAAQKRGRIEARFQSLGRFSQAHPDLDLEVANFFPLEGPLAEAFAVDFDAVDKANRPFARKAVMALQRTRGLTETFAEADALLSSGLDNAAVILNVGDSDAIAERTGLSRAAAMRVRAAALEKNSRITHFVHALESATTHATFNPAVLEQNAGALDLDLVNVLKDIPGYSELFGNQNYCKCRHCRSIFSPAAYFVDLMRYIESKISKPIFLSKGLQDHPLYLRNRRPDLWKVPLTCANTDTLIPYLVVVNEVLADYLERTFNVTDIFTALADPEKAKMSFHQPFNLPFAELLLYLQHLGVSRNEIVSQFEVPPSARARATLELSAEEFAAITTPGVSGIQARFGIDSNSDLSELDTALICRAASVSREELTRLLSLDFIRADLSLDVQITGDLVGFTENVSINLPQGGRAPASTVRLFLDRLHRFIRLWHVLPWTLEELQMFLGTLTEAKLTGNTEGAAELLSVGLDESILIQIGNLRRLQILLNVEPSELHGLVAQIPVAPTRTEGDSLFTRLFGTRSELEIRHPWLDNLEQDDPFVSPDFGLLQGALKLDEADLVELIRQTLSAEEIAAAVFSLPQLSHLYRRAALADRLGITLRALELLETLVSASIIQGGITERITVALEILETHETIKRTPFSPEDVTDLLAQNTTVQAEKSSQLAEELNEIRAEIVASGILAVTPEALATIKGMDAASAVAILRSLANLPVPWLESQDERAESFLLTAGVEATPDPLILGQALADTGLPLEADPNAEATTERLILDLTTLFQRRHPLTLVMTAVRARRELSDAFLEAIEPLRREELFAAGGLSAFFSWMRDQSASPPEQLVATVSEIDRLMDLFRSKLSASLETIRFVSEHQGLFVLDGIVQLSWTGLRRIGAYFTRTKALGGDNEPLHAVLTAWNGTAFPAAADSDLAQVLKASVNDVAGLRDEIPVVNSPFEALVWIEKGVRLSRRLGIDSIALRQVAAESYDGLVAARDLVYGAIRAKYEQDQDWREHIGPYEEKIEGIKRDALVDRILSVDLLLNFRDSREIYQFFLLDVEMDGCAKTFRVKAAISSCQLYVQRSLMRLEQSQDGSVIVSIKNELARKEWEWRKHYRVWQANREVFVYPENYLLPDLRTDKSHLFGEAESALLQGTLNAEAINMIIANYLRGLVELGSLTIVSCYYDKDIKQYILFGRTSEQPYRYFMRRFDGKSEFTVWEPIDLDIGAKTVSPVKKNGRLYLFWTDLAVDHEADSVRSANSPWPSREDDGSEEKDCQKETLPISAIYARMEPSGAWSQPQRLFFYNLFTHRQENCGSTHGPEFLEAFELSSRLYAAFPYAPVHGGNPNNANRIQLIHTSSVESTIHYRRFYDLEAKSSLHEEVAFLDELNNKLVGWDGKNIPPLGQFTDLPNTAWFASSGIACHAETAHGWVQKISFWRETFELEKSKLVKRVNLPELTENGFRKFTSDAAKETDQNFLRDPENSVTLLEAPKSLPCRMHYVSGSQLDNVFQIGDQIYLIRWTGGPGYPMTDSFEENWVAAINSRRHLIRLSTSRPLELANIFFDSGINHLLKPASQELPDNSFNDIRAKFHWPGELAPAIDGPIHLLSSDSPVFLGPNAIYDWELYFHLPFLIAHYLNSQGKFEEANRFYQFIFDPTAPTESGQSTKIRDVWRFLEFRKQDIPKLRDILTDKAAIKVYQSDPFNPFAIARLRPSAFQKAVVMRYVDNLLDWGDYLYGSLDTLEALNEATMLYVMASDILGDRPRELGECETSPEDMLTYANISMQNAGADFLIELENLIDLFKAIPFVNAKEALNPAKFFAFAGSSDEPESTEMARGSGFAAMARRENETFASLHATIARRAAFVSTDALNVDHATRAPVAGIGDLASYDAPPEPDPPIEPGSFDIALPTRDDPDPDGPILEQRRLGFCVPPNETLSGYWDRVEDRLFKIRHCMNIEGVVRQLPLWQPRIDPLLLVRAKAAGLDIDQVLAQLYEPPPRHRFRMLLEKARQFTGTAQQFGAQLLSALERKDEQELAELRSLHEDTILNLMRRQKQDAIDTALKELDRICEQKKVIEGRRDYNKDLIENATADPKLGINTEEYKAQNNFDKAKEKNETAAKREDKAAQIRQFGPQWSVSANVGGGGEFSQFGPVANTQIAAAYGSENVDAGYRRAAQKHRSDAQVAETEASMALRRADYKRRRDQWIHERDTAIKELDALVPEELAAEIRLAIAEQELGLHNKQIEQAREVYNFAKDRFTTLGLYTYLSTTLGRLYRQAYDMAYQMASNAQRAYQFETADQRFFLSSDNWNATRSGLLAADKLLLQLQAMEASYLERDQRRLEIAISCSLAQINPEALLRLRRMGQCGFRIPEWYFDLTYPGQYKRLIQTVKVQIPCVTGPYINVGALLTLTESRVREAPRLDPGAVRSIPAGRNTTIATSSANSDTGVIDLRLDGEQYPPFHLAGAESEWNLQLPDQHRSFDYATISDVIIELTYSAFHDGVFRNAVAGSEGTIEQHFNEGMVRILSFRHEFPSIYHALTGGQSGIASAVLRIGKKHFPSIFHTRSISIDELALILEPRSVDTISLDAFSQASAVINGIETTEWDVYRYQGDTDLVSATISANNLIISDDLQEIELSLTLPESIRPNDVYLLVRYRTED